MAAIGQLYMKFDAIAGRHISLTFREARRTTGSNRPERFDNRRLAAVVRSDQYRESTRGPARLGLSERQCLVGGETPKSLD